MRERGYWSRLPKPKLEVVNVLLLEKGEEILTVYDGGREIIKEKVGNWGTIKKGKEVEFGCLVLTSRRLIWVTSRGIFKKSWHITYSIPLEDIKGISGGGALRKYISVSDSHRENIFHLRAYFEVFKFDVQKAIKARREEIEAEKKKERVHILLDFSFLKDYMKKGGLVIQRIKCPKCDAKIKLPKAGAETICDYCGSTIYAYDIFEKIKALIG